LNTRIYIKKQNEFDVKTDALQSELAQIGINAQIKVYSSYDIFNTSEEELKIIIPSVFSDPVIEECLFQLPQHDQVIAIEYLPGQFDLRADAAMQCCQLLLEHNNIIIQTSQLIGLNNIKKTDIPVIKNYLINLVDSREKDLNVLKQPEIDAPSAVLVIADFIKQDKNELEFFLSENKLSIDIEDIICIQNYFINENRNPTITEIKALDTYWSDHCRHTTFLTHLNNIKFEGSYKDEMKNTFDKYLLIKKEIRKGNTPITLMELGTLLPKYFVSKNKLAAYHHSRENNAATIEIDVDVDGENEKWLLLFKNETHNHPTEIEPFGGAATCIGGAIRDPLSGRAFVYQAMRISGAGNPIEPINETISSKLSQQKISKEAALGYSSYGNQIGLATSLVAEIFHEGYKAKRFECGFVIAAVKKNNVKEEDPIPGDMVLLIGGDTGRDGIGGASGSSKQHNETSIATMQSEVQKGNAITERKIQKLFKRPEVISLIKKSNDFGAGGVCVAIGEIADSIEINLNKVPLKYEGLNGTEIALSESQERMAVVVRKEDASLFINYANEESVNATHIATVTDDGVLRMKWNDLEIVSLKRSFLHTNGAPRNNDVTAIANEAFQLNQQAFSKKEFLKALSSKEVASQKGMVEHFDSTVYGNTYFMPFGGKYQLSPSDVSAHFICDETYTTNTVSMASWGYHPKFTEANQYLGGIYAIIESISKIVAAGGNYSSCYLSFQEYFEKLGKEASTWGKPFTALLGAFEAQYNLDIAAIGGKDSMSGSFKNIHVPPTFISFAITTQKADNIISTELKSNNSYIYLFELPINKKKIPEWQQLKEGWNTIYSLINAKIIISAKNVKDGGIAACIAQMSFGNKIGVTINTVIDLLDLKIGSIIIESTTELDKYFLLIGKTNKSNQLIFNGISISIEEAIEQWTSTFSKLFPISTNTIEKNILPINIQSKLIKNIGFGKPNVFIPIFPGTNCEYETADAFTKEDGNVNTLVFNNHNKETSAKSIVSFCKQIDQTQILVFSGGFSCGDEPDGSAKYIVNVLKNKNIQQSVHQLIERGGLILGICNGFQALIKSGLLPYAEIKDLDSFAPTLLHNQIGRHVSQMVKVKVVNDNSPWLQGMYNKEFIIPVSHGEGRFYSCESTLDQLIEQRQIATQYVNHNGEPSNIFPHNPNGSICAIEGLISSNGNIFGRMGHPERAKEGRLKNIPDVYYHNIFKNGVSYFN